MRVAGAIPILFLVALVIFVILRLAPGDAADLLLPDEASGLDIAKAREQWGLDKPILEQYLSFFKSMVTLDFGMSYRYRMPVGDLIAERLPATIELATVALVIALLVGVPAGLLAALRKGRAADTIVSIFAVAGVSTPSFWLAIILVMFFSGELHLLPSSGRLPHGLTIPTMTGIHVVDAILAGQFHVVPQILSHLLLPAGTLAFAMVGLIARIVRSALIDVGQEEFIYTAVAKGVNRGGIIRRHLFPNAMIPIVTVVGLELGVLISGSIIVEVVFSWPGIGTLLYQAISVRDIPLVTGIVTTYTVLFIAINVVIDIIYFMIDPRVRASQAG